MAAITLAFHLNAAMATNITNTVPFDPPLNIWTDQSLSIPQFNASNGTLRNVQLAFNMQTDGTIRIRNGCTQRKTINFAYSNSFVLRVLETNFEAATESRTGLALSPGETAEFGSQSKRRTVTFDVSETGKFIGNGTTVANVSRAGSVTATCVEGGCGCVAASIVSFDIRGEVSVIYTFDPPPPPRINWELAPNGLDLLLSWPIQEGFSYVLETSTGFDNWLPISTNAAPTIVAREQVAIGTEAERFFRISRAAVVVH
ncbi:MAG: choice-of-anchor E domain-containing protein [Verrucomicrobiales bacterium]|nr:choice-of-anchor E domain-containing protein [Verrucomicrobiales bacterium]